MKNQVFLSEQLEQMKYLFSYKKGRVISEQDVRQGYKEIVNKEDTTFPKTNLQNLFSMGQIDSNKLRPEIEALRPKIEEFIKSAGGKKFNLNITAGESQITNPKGYEQKGSLALARANTVKKYFGEVFKDLIDQGVLKVNTPTSVEDVSIGPTEYKSQSISKNDKNHQFYLDNKEKYDQEQFVSFTIDGTGVKETKSYVCDYSAQGSGGYAKKDDDFMLFPPKTLDVSKLPDGTKIKFSLVSHTIPDLMIINAGGNVYSTGWVGLAATSKYERIFLATILGNAYNGKPPSPFPQDLVQLDMSIAHSIFDTYRNMEKVLGHVIKIDWSKKIPKQVEQIKWYDFTKNPLISSNPDDRNWKHDGGKSIIITKDPSFGSVTYRIYSPIGITAWKFFAECL